MMNIGGGPLGAMSSRIFDENTEGITGVKSGASRKGLKDSNIPVNHIGSFTRSIDSLIHSIFTLTHLQFHRRLKKQVI